MRKKQWVEEQNGEHERRTSDEDVGDLLLGVDEVLGNPAIPRRGRTGKATKMKFITYRHQTRESGRPRQRSLDDQHDVELDIPPGKETNLLPWNSFGSPTGLTMTLTTNASLKRLACEEGLLHLQGG